MSEIEHTQGEWSVRTTPHNSLGVYWREIICGDECVIGEIYYSDTGDAEASANAALIVRAVNSHYKLIEALIQCRSVLGTALADYNGNATASAVIARKIEMCNATLAEARGE